MAGHLQVSKLPDQRRNRVQHTVPKGATVVVRDGVLRGPSIEDATGRDDWPPAVRAWWQTWREAPQAALFEDTDWRRLATVTPLYAQYVQAPTAAALAEIRRTEDGLGATFVDRLRARIVVQDPGEDAGVAEATFQDRITEIQARIHGGRGPSAVA